MLPTPAAREVPNVHPSVLSSSFPILTKGSAMVTKNRMSDSELALAKKDIDSFGGLAVPDSVTRAFATSLVKRHGRDLARQLVTAALEEVEAAIAVAETSEAR
jgi:hypothetical protein